MRRLARAAPSAATWQAPRPAVPGAAGAAASGVRHIRTGFFPEDADWMDPEGPLFAERINMRWRYMDDAALRASVLERSNVGMGMLVLNRAQGLDLPTINELYRRLRDLEVNTLKRVVGLAATEPGPFCVGLDPQELLLGAVTAARSGGKRLPVFTRALLWHIQELAHLVGDYRKPVVCHLGDKARDEGAALACLSSFSGAYEGSEVAVEACFAGLVPFGGMTYVLGQLEWHLGEFLALTGHRVSGSDLVYTGLVRHWLSPEALPFLELTAEKQLEVTEADARALLDEHSLPVPPGLTESSSVASWMVPVINQAFSKDSVPLILEDLEMTSTTNKSSAVQQFAKDCASALSRACPLAATATLKLIKLARKSIESEAKGQRGLVVKPGMHGEHGNLTAALRRELRAQQRLLLRSDAVRGLRSRCMGQAVIPGVWSHRSSLDVTNPEVEVLLNEPTYPEAGVAAEFVVQPRGEFPLSQHPRLRRYHPDYDPATGMDHDPAWMAQEVKRWSPDLFAEQRERAMQDLLGGRDPGAYGQSRWVRVEGGAT